jgi:beta-phosphoglucomutase
MSIKAVLFDFDGTLVHTESMGFEALRDTFQKKGYALTREDQEFCSGRKWAMAFEHLWEKYQVPQDQRTQLSGEAITMYHQKIQQPLEWTPGVQAAIRALKPHFRLAVVSGSKKDHLRLILTAYGLWDLMDAVYGEEDYGRSKPDPEGFLTAGRNFGLQPQECVVFEDSQAGILSGVNAGCFVVAVSHFNRFHDLSLAHRTIRDFLDVNPDWVQSLVS